MTLIFSNYLVLFLLWCLFFLVHSILATLGLKKAIHRHAPRLMPYYRLIFNLIAIISVIPPLYYMHVVSGSFIWQWPVSLHWLQYLIVFLTLILFLWTLRYYDGKEFLGIRQLMEKNEQPEDQEHFFISPAHRLVRHPWYTLALLLLWSRDMYESYLFSTILITIYFVLGSKLEEKKLLQYHGEAYREYLKRVSGIFPLPWKFLSRKEAMHISRLSNNEKP